MQVLEDGGISSPRGFRAAGIHAGVKVDSTKKDLALVYSLVPASAAAVYTTNRVQAAPIHIDREHLRDGRAQAVVLNSGNANACTGARGLADGRRMCARTAALLDLEPVDVLVCSTGAVSYTHLTLPTKA